LDLLDVSIAIAFDYNSSHIELLLDNESLSVALDLALVSSHYPESLTVALDLALVSSL
jgi:uncharacterized membrane protein